MRLAQRLHAARQNAGGRAAPAGVQQREPAVRGCREVDRDAVGHRDGEHEARAVGGVPVDAVELGPAHHAALVPGHPVAVDLGAEHRRPEARLARRAERRQRRITCPTGCSDQSPRSKLRARVMPAMSPNRSRQPGTS